MAQRFLTAAEFIERIGAVETDNVAGEGLRGQRSINMPKIEGSIGYAEAFVIGYIRARYPNPIEPVPEMLKEFVAWIAFYRLRYKVGDTSGVALEVKTRYDEAMARLRDIQSGRLAIDANQPGTNNAPAQELPVLHSGSPSRARAILDQWPLRDGAGARRP